MLVDDKIVVDAKAQSWRRALNEYDPTRAKTGAGEMSPRIEELKSDASIAEYANAVVRELKNVVAVEDNGEMYRYDPSGVYINDAKVRIEGLLEFYKPDINTHEVNEILAKIRRANPINRSV